MALQRLQPYLFSDQRHCVCVSQITLRIYLAAIAIYTNAVKGISALQLGHDLGVQYKTAFVLANIKLRESLMEQRDMAQLTGEVHIDGAYVNGHIRPKNKKQIVLIDV